MDKVDNLRAIHKYAESRQSEGKLICMRKVDKVDNLRAIHKYARISSPFFVFGRIQYCRRRSTANPRWELTRWVTPRHWLSQD